MITKKTMLSVFILLSLLISTSSCFLSRNPNKASRGKRFPHDEHPGEKKQ